MARNLSGAGRGETKSAAVGEQKWAPVLQVVLLVTLVGAALFGLTLAIHIGLDEPYGRLTRDPTAVLKAPPYVGFLSQVGIFFWSAAAAATLLAAGVLRSSASGTRPWSFFLTAGALSLLLGLDDAFLLHERVLPHFGIPEEAVIAVYALLMTLWLVSYRKWLMVKEGILLLTALMFFAMSVLLDLIPFPWQISTLYEDGAKLVGILFWLAFFVRAAMSDLHTDRK